MPLSMMTTAPRASSRISRHALSRLAVLPNSLTRLQSLTSAWLQTHPEQFQPYVDRPLRDYCAARIEPTVCEIEHVGMSALVDMLVKPAGVMVEILYLDRSPGTEANTFRWEPVGQTGIPLPNPPAIRLLYRPYVKNGRESWPAKLMRHLGDIMTFSTSSKTSPDVCMHHRPRSKTSSSLYSTPRLSIIIRPYRLHSTITSSPVCLCTLVRIWAGRPARNTILSLQPLLPPWRSRFLVPYQRPITHRHP